MYVHICECLYLTTLIFRSSILALTIMETKYQKDNNNIIRIFPPETGWPAGSSSTSEGFFFLRFKI